MSRLPRLTISIPALVLAASLAGCAADGSGNGLFSTGSIAGDTPPQPQRVAEPRVDPQCVTLSSQIDGLRKDGVADKIEKAAAKKYKMTAADLAKADQLTKANADFQQRCSTITPRAVTASAAPAIATPTAKPKTQ